MGNPVGKQPRLSIHDSQVGQFTHWTQRSEGTSYTSMRHTEVLKLVEFGKGMQNGSRSITTRAGSNLSSEYKINVNFWLNTGLRTAEDGSLS